MFSNHKQAVQRGLGSTPSYDCFHRFVCGNNILRRLSVVDTMYSLLLDFLYCTVYRNLSQTIVHVFPLATQQRPVFVAVACQSLFFFFFLFSRLKFVNSHFDWLETNLIG
jgi:hypothetical protein